MQRLSHIFSTDSATRGGRGLVAFGPVEHHIWSVTRVDAWQIKGSKCDVRRVVHMKTENLANATNPGLFASSL